MQAIGWVVDGTPGDKLPGQSNGPLSTASLDVLLLAMQLGPESPLEIQINGTKGNMTDGFWIPSELTSISILRDSFACRAISIQG